MFRTAGLAMLSRPQAVVRPMMYAAPAVMCQMRFTSVKVEKQIVKPKVVKKTAKVVKPDNYPKGAKLAYFIFMGENRAKVAAKHPGLSIGSLSKKIGAMYNALAPKDKANYVALAAKDKKRFESEMTTYIANGGVKIPRNSKKVKKVKDPNMPKRNVSAFFIFLSEKRAEAIKAVGNDPRNIGKRIGEMWAVVTPKEKARLAGLAAKDKLRYVKELKAGGYPVKA